MVFQVGHPKYGGKVKGSRNKVTLALEERRAIFEEEVSQVFVNKIHEARPEYILDQFIGKSPDKLISLNLDEKPTERERELLSRLLHR